jgi:hypothetical protein
MKKVERKELLPVNHEDIEYQPFRKNFYLPPKDLINLNLD